MITLIHLLNVSVGRFLPFCLIDGLDFLGDAAPERIVACAEALDIARCGKQCFITLPGSSSSPASVHDDVVGGFH